MKVLLVALAALAGPALAQSPAPSSAWLERQQTAAADEADAAGSRSAKAPEAKERCRVVKQWKVRDTVVEHRVCEDAPKPEAPARQG
ncbi:hypothetical protein C1929_13670 [Stenotrophomonas sp. ZAC14D1_NAIMI4_6]|uniref:hypothetical protein n=1 Tax=unclassified Stenotrophomonas maltophilia group TaxID=2961925 RepID=UPI000D542AFF|nr:MULTISPECIES: hypothetical protein [unclassified Stenotrophomonas maltophilia group]AWH37725.1 hypothetical protein C1929_13670 [Stenotrophomonas sp. ZAC14D1_NAIMI4_6]AWH41859.1 hypothetical protein C1927_13680 [Stenotrophomonas sp. ZAC14D1_NAIMI4_1]